jgi:hypothetical protein
MLGLVSKVSATPVYSLLFSQQGVDWPFPYEMPRLMAAKSPRRWCRMDAGNCSSGTYSGVGELHGLAIAVMSRLPREHRDYAACAVEQRTGGAEAQGGE